MCVGLPARSGGNKIAKIRPKMNSVNHTFIAGRFPDDNGKQKLHGREMRDLF